MTGLNECRLCNWDVPPFPEQFIDEIGVTHFVRAASNDSAVVVGPTFVFEKPELVTKERVELAEEAAPIRRGKRHRLSHRRLAKERGKKILPPRRRRRNLSTMRHGGTVISSSTALWHPHLNWNKGGLALETTITTLCLVVCPG